MPCIPSNLNTIKKRSSSRNKKRQATKAAKAGRIYAGRLFTHLFSLRRQKACLTALRVKYAVGSVTKQDTKPVVKNVSEATLEYGVIDHGHVHKPGKQGIQNSIADSGYENLNFYMVKSFFLQSCLLALQ